MLVVYLTSRVESIRPNKFNFESFLSHKKKELNCTLLLANEAFSKKTKCLNCVIGVSYTVSSKLLAYSSLVVNPETIIYFRVSVLALLIWARILLNRSQNEYLSSSVIVSGVNTKLRYSIWVQILDSCIRLPVFSLKETPEIASKVNFKRPC